ncbi:MAG: DUF262 domain-containing protein [Oceanospirillaceae bacterium]|nr:DUF262 domain-containing protein [Oceanospirillaceae bacterium]
MSQKVEAYNIYDIAKWQTSLRENYDVRAQGNVVTLPTLQRGFVWKPYQIEALWDSILRGFPIGGLLLSQVSEFQKDLLDGQQRCTAISLGFKDPFAPESAILNLKNPPALWIDLQPLDLNNSDRLFGVRALTVSHPWGYRLGNHKKQLPATQMNRAWQFVKEKNNLNSEQKYTEIPMSHRTPWDCRYPIPLFVVLEKFSTECIDFDHWKSALINYANENLKGIQTLYHEVDYSKVEDKWLETLYEGLKLSKDLLIPEIPTSKDTLFLKGGKTREDYAIPFVRLNSEGVRLSNEELIYSTFKAHFKEAKTLVESFDYQFAAPSRIVNLFVRMSISISDENLKFQNELNVSEFRIHLQNENFKESLRKSIQSKEHTQLFEKAFEILKSHPANLPAVFIKSLISASPDLIFVVLVYSKRNPKLSGSDTRNIRQVFIRSLLLNKSADRKKLARQVHKIVNNKNSNGWIFDAVNGSSDVITPLPSTESLKDFLIDKLLQSVLREETTLSYWHRDLALKLLSEDVSLRDAFCSIKDESEDELAKTSKLNSALDNWNVLRKIIFGNRQLLVIAQRKYFNSNFGEFNDFSNLQDTSRPWDWDHIYPNNKFRGERAHKKAKNLKDCIANFRAISFQENRSEGDRRSPSERFSLENERANSFVKSNDFKHWKELSFKEDELIERESLNHFMEAIFQRTYNLYLEFYEVIMEKE